MATQNDIKSLEQALTLLEKASKDSKSQVTDLLKKDYAELAKVFSETTPQIKKALNGAANVSAENIKDFANAGTAKAKEFAKGVDTQVHDNPWAYLGVAALGGAIIGYLSAKK